MKKLFDMVKMSIWPSVTIMFAEGVVTFYEIEVWLTVLENPQEWVNLGHSSHFYLVDKVIIDSEWFGTCNCPWQISGFYQMLGTAFGMLMDSFPWAVCPSTTEGKQNSHVSFHQNAIPWASLSYTVHFLLSDGEKNQFVDLCSGFMSLI